MTRPRTPTSTRTRAIVPVPQVQDAWFGPDGLHYRSVGYRERAVRIAGALARAFPRDGASPTACFVGSR